MNIDSKIQNYLKECYGPEANLTDIQHLGEGVHGEAYLLKFRTPREERRLIMKTLFPSGFGHDHFSDRAQVLLLAHDNYSEMGKHIKATDVAGETPDRLISLKKAHEFYIFMDEAKGDPYFKDLNEILERGRLIDIDRKRAKELAQCLGEIHATKYSKENAKTIYRRRIRDLIGHGECTLGIIDSYDQVDFTTDRELVDYAGKCLSWWGKIRDRSERLCQVHGDYHPGNIWFQQDDFTLLDRSRGTWGEPADDLSCLGVNYIYFAIKDRGTFEGPFSELFRLFMSSYLEETNDYGLFGVVQPFFAFRVLVIANPKFYPDDMTETKRKLLNFGNSVLETEKFAIEKISDYIEGK